MSFTEKNSSALVTTSTSKTVTNSSLAFPSFSSFSAPQPPKLDSSELRKIADESDSDTSSFKASKKKKKRKKKSKHEKPIVQEANEPQMYYKDASGDDKNVIYGNVVGAIIPDYKRLGDRIWGDLTDSWRIDVKLSRRNRYIVLYNIYGRADQSFSNSNRYQAFKEALKLRPIRVRKGKQDVDARTMEYIPFPSTGIDFTEMDFDAVDSMDVDVESFHQDLEFQRHCADLDRQIQKDPKNALLWLQFIDYQDKLAVHTTGKRRSAILRFINEKKMTIFEKALAELPSCEDLLVGYMKCSCDFLP
jgi:hypothetical protein